MLRYIAATLALFSASGRGLASLVGRAPATPGGTDYQAYYDTVLLVTWLAEGNLARTSGYNAEGLMTWAAAQAWIASLNAQNAGQGYLGVNSWRLPTVTDTATPGCNFAFTGTDCGYNVNLATGEMASMFYATLDNTAAYDTSGAAQACGNAPPNRCLTNVGPFSNFQPADYWSGTAYAPDATNAWAFAFDFGSQGNFDKGFNFYAWAVAPGDPLGDVDGDGVQNSRDNCLNLPNPNQRDSNGDGYGNLCDPDFNGDGTVNINDFNRLKARLGISPVVDVDTDLDGNGAVNINDLNRLKSFLGKSPGLSGLHPNCPPTCP